MTPTLTTDRLILRGHTAADFDACCTLWADPELTRYITGRPSTPEETWQRIQRYAGHWQLLGFGYFLITDRESGAVVGEVGLADFRRQMTPAFEVPEVGWALAPAYWGRGLASEALAAVLAWAEAQGHTDTVCMMDPENTASRRLAERMGYREYGRTKYKEFDSILFERPAKPGR